MLHGHQGGLVVRPLPPLVQHGVLDWGQLPKDVLLVLVSYLLLEHSSDQLVVLITHDCMPVGLADGEALADGVGLNHELGTLVETHVEGTDDDGYSDSQLVVVAPVYLEADVADSLVEEDDLVYLIELVEDHCVGQFLAGLQL